MKKLIVLLLALSLLLCGVAGAEEAVTMGLLDYLSIEFDSHEQMESERAPEDNDEDGARARVFFDSLSPLVLALNAGKVSYVYLPEITAAYVAARNPGLTYAVKTTSPNVFKMAVSSGNAELYEALDGAIESLLADGTIDALAEKWINDSSEEIEAAEMPAYDGEPILIGVTGDQPPLDYMDAGGTPSGFNVALLKEISRALGRPVELVSIESNARVTALLSGKLDAVFWVRQFADTDAPEDSGVLLTRPYYSCYSAFMTKDFPIEDMKAIEKIYE